MDSIADMLTRIRNAQAAKKADVSMPASNFKLAIAKLLHKEGYLKEVSIFSEGEKKYLKLVLKYINKEPVICGIKQISKQGQRIYVGNQEIQPVKNNHGISIISTPKGVLSGAEARRQKVGGELICEIW